MVSQALKNVPKGFKQSDVGMIPEDWRVAVLGTCLLGKPKYGVNAAAVPYSDKLPVYIRITDISEDGRFMPDKLVSVDHFKSSDYFLEEGDLVFARTGASVGKSYLYGTKDGALVYAGFLIRVKPDPNKLLPTYLSNYVRTQRYWNWVQLMSMRSGQPGINGNEYSQLPIPLSTIPEQAAIATVLSDTDALIESLEKLIAKKRAIKQGAMQELLTGKRRLPGFSGKWETKRLGEIGSFKKGKGIKKNSVISYGLPCIRYGEIYTHHNDYIKKYNSYISIETAKTSQKIKKGDLLFAGSGETAEEIGKCVAYLGDGEAYAGGDIVILSPNGYDSKYLGFLMNHKAVITQKSQLGQGDTVVHIYSSALAKVLISVPPTKAEQTVIAEFLSDMDFEIEALVQKLEKYKQLKQGIMQVLLTGKVRLV